LRGLGHIIGSRVRTIDTAQGVKWMTTKVRLFEYYGMAGLVIVEGLVNSVACGSARDNGIWDHTSE